jgi:hypothetical protein
MPTKTIVQQPVNRGDITNVVVVMGTNATWNAVYIPHDASGNKIGMERSYSLPFGSDPDYLAWLTNVVLPALNAHEGT